jgi:crotonobetainyl-CoA:carnitine CoA-transferase CaiB-like acyl-CoA transferase
MMQLGADVIKIEHPRHGDGNRHFPPFSEGEGVHHLHLNVGTRSLAVDPGTPQWRRVVQAVARWADVVIVGNRPSSAERLGIDFASLQRVNPNLVYCLISGYGIEGEWAGLPAHGLNMDALAGTVTLEWKEGLPRVPHAYRTIGTTAAGMHAAMAIYAALDRRHRGGGGQVVHVSIWEAALAWMWRDLATYANTGKPWTAYQDLGSRYAVYAAADGKALLVCPIEQRFWTRFCDALGLPAELKARGDWSGGTDAGAAYEGLGERAILQEHLRARSRDEWVAVLTAAEVPVAAVLDWSEAMASAHAEDNGVMAAYVHRGREVRVPTTPASITAAASVMVGGYPALAERHRRKADLVSRPPELGEHNAELLRDLGLSDEIGS